MSSQKFPEKLYQTGEGTEDWVTSGWPLCEKSEACYRIPCTSVLHSYSFLDFGEVLPRHLGCMQCVWAQVLPESHGGNNCVIPIKKVNLGGGSKILISSLSPVPTSSQLCSVLLQKVGSRVTEMTPWLRALVALLEDPITVTSSHIDI